MIKCENTIFEISLLISKFLVGEISREERERLQEWKNESEHHAALFDKICSGERMAEKIDMYLKDEGKEAFAAFLVEKRKWEKSQSSPVPSLRNVRRLWLWRVSVAAAIVLLVCVSAWWENGKVKDAFWVNIPEEPAGQIVKLIAGSGQIFNLDTLKQIEGNLASVRNQNGKLVFSSKKKKSGMGTKNTIEVPQGAEYELILTDGTRVFLNSGTSFQFPESFPDEGDREVYLSGEAYFKVTTDSVRPFVVHTDFTYTKVMGTEFNVMAYKNSVIQQTTLVKGKVKVGCRDMAGELELLPGMQSSYDKNTGDIGKQNVDVSYFIAWKEGIFAFRECRLNEVMEVLSRWYGFQFFFQSTKIQDYVYTGKIERHSDLNSVLNQFKMTGEMDFEIDGKVIIVKDKK